MPFSKGHKKVGGRVEGTPNKSRVLKDRVLATASKKDMDELCEKYPAIFWNLVGKCVDRSVEIGQDETKEAVTLLIRGYNEGNKPTSSSS